MRAPARPLRDAKTVLQEWAQARGLPTPAYREVERKGPDHDPEFRVTVELPNRARPKGSAAPSAPPSRPPPPPCSRARASRRNAAMAEPATGGRQALRLHRADRRAQCRQVDAGQRAGRRQGHDRLAQGADHAHAGARHRDRRRGAARLHRYAGHFCAAAPARPRHGDDRLGGRPRRRHRRRADRRQARHRRGDEGRSSIGSAMCRQPKLLVLNKVDLVDKPALLALTQR